MKLLLQSVAIAAGLMIGHGVRAEDINTEHQYLGAGRLSCASWIQHIRQGGSAAESDKSWLYGFFSGYNAFFPGPKSVFMSYDEHSLVDAIYSDCARSPELPLGTVAMKFLNALRTK